MRNELESTIAKTVQNLKNQAKLKYVSDVFNVRSTPERTLNKSLALFDD